jgi:protein-disulfide isomerase
MKFCVAALLFLLPCFGALPDVDKGKSFGNPAAPITIEIYSDFGCPFCKELHEKVLPQLTRDFIDKGKVYLVFREFPLVQAHPHTMEASIFATAAARAGKYQPVADELFRTQQDWMSTGNVWSAVASVLSPAERKQVEQLAKDPSVREEVRRNTDEAHNAGVKSLPTMIVTHKGSRYPISGAQNYALIHGFLTDMLAR